MSEWTLKQRKGRQGPQRAQIAQQVLRSLLQRQGSPKVRHLVTLDVAKDGATRPGRSSWEVHARMALSPATNGSVRSGNAAGPASSTRWQHTSFRTAPAATTVTASERTTRGHVLRRGCCGGREAPSGQRSRAGGVCSRAPVQAQARHVARCCTRCGLRSTRLGEAAHPGPSQRRPPLHRPPTSMTISRQPCGTRLPSCIECQQRFAAHNLRMQATSDVVSTPPWREGPL